VVDTQTAPPHQPNCELNLGFGGNEGSGACVHLQNLDQISATLGRGILPTLSDCGNMAPLRPYRRHKMAPGLR